MTQLDRATVWRRLRVIRHDVELLAPEADISLSEYLAGGLRRAGIERLLQTATEATLDICKHLLRANGLPRPEKAFDIVIAVGDAGFIPTPLAEALAPATGLRNRLVHEYDDLDDAKVHASIPDTLRLLPQFAAAVERYLDEPSR